MLLLIAPDLIEVGIRGRMVRVVVASVIMRVELDVPHDAATRAAAEIDAFHERRARHVVDIMPARIVGAEVDALIGINQSRVDRVHAMTFAPDRPGVRLDVVPVLLVIVDGQSAHARGCCQRDQRGRPFRRALAVTGEQDRAAADRMMRHVPGAPQLDASRHRDRRINPIAARRQIHGAAARVARRVQSLLYRCRSIHNAAAIREIRRRGRVEQLPASRPRPHRSVRRDLLRQPVQRVPVVLRDIDFRRAALVRHLQAAFQTRVHRVQRLRCARQLHLFPRLREARLPKDERPAAQLDRMAAVRVVPARERRILE
ncbi:hypothetical protein COHCIP112018_05577 [Cohnella sp. JJ-181]|nr:hypothetical protein COHCIP112018_05577 [Cohnella sp. JJ-181]